MSHPIATTTAPAAASKMSGCRSDDDQEHRGGVGGSDDRQPAIRGELGECDADDQRIAEVQARDGRDRVVEAAEQVGAQVEPVWVVTVSAKPRPARRGGAAGYRTYPISASAALTISVVRRNGNACGRRRCTR